MRHRCRSRKLGRSTAHLDAMLSALVRGLIAQKRITTTLVKAKMARSLAEKMVTRAFEGTLAARRLILAALHDEGSVEMLFKDIAPKFADRRTGGYTRIIKLGHRVGDGGETALLEWVGIAPPQRKKKKKADEKTEKAAKPEKPEKPEKADKAEEKPVEKPKSRTSFWRRGKDRG